MDAHQQALTEPNLSEEEWRHNSYKQELREFAAIESGDPDSLRKAVSEVSGSLGKLADTPIRNAKNLMHCLHHSCQQSCHQRRHFL